MRAELNDRTILSEEPEISPVSVPRIFAVGLVLPFAHPIRLFLGSILPVLLIVVATMFGPIGRIIAGWQSLAFSQPAELGAGTAAPPSLPADFGLALVEGDGILLLALALLLCAWQRAVAKGFGEPVLRWLGGSLLGLPGYILAFAIWVLAPALVVSLPFGALGLLLAQAVRGMLMTPQDQMQTVAGMFDTLQWSLLGIALLLIALLALWLNARLSPLPALVASQGWRHAFGRAWQLSRGHGFGLSLSLFAYTILAFLLLMIAGIVFSVTMFSHADSLPDPHAMAIIWGVTDAAVTALIGLWHASLGALVVREGLSPAETIDPALFG